MLSDHGGADFFGDYCFYFLCLKTQKQNCWIIRSSNVNILSNLILFFIEAALIYFPLKSAKGFPYSKSLLTLIFYHFDDCHTNRHEVMSHCSFDFHLLGILKCRKSCSGFRSRGSGLWPASDLPGQCPGSVPACKRSKSNCTLDKKESGSWNSWVPGLSLRV